MTIFENNLEMVPKLEVRSVQMHKLFLKKDN